MQHGTGSSRSWFYVIIYTSREDMRQKTIFFHISASNDLDLSPLDRRIALPVTDDVDNISCKFRSDISAGNSLSVPQYSVVPFFYTDVLIYLCHYAVY